MDKKNNIKRVIALVCATLVVALLAAMPLIAKQTSEEDGPKASILSDTVTTGSIHTKLIGGGTLTEDDAVTISVPAAVKLTKFLVANGDMVAEGTPIASVDRVTVMTAISQVQETLEYLSEQIEDAGNTSTTEKVTALAGGTVKIIYAQQGESVQNVMLDHGALAVLSLDGLMAVDLETGSDLAAGTAVIVTLSDGTQVAGKITKNLAGEMTVTVEDDGYPDGETVQVTAEDGTVIGSAALYIYSPWNATAYAGTVESIKVNVGDTLSAGKTLMVLSDVGYSATYRQLISQRQEYEELMLELFQMYQTQTITAPSDGIVSGVDEDGAYMLSDNGSGWAVKLLSFFGKDTHDGFVASAAKVEAVTESGMTLLMASKQYPIEDLTQLSVISADTSAMDSTWNYSGDTKVYTQTESGLLQQAGNAQVGDVLLVVGDEEKVQWFVVLDENNTSVQQLSDPVHNSNAFVTLLSELEDGDQNGAQGNEAPPADSEEPPAGGEEPPTGGEEPPAGNEENNGTESTETYLGYVAQVTEVDDSSMKVKQTAYAYPVDLDHLPTVSVDTNALTEEVTYTSDLITEADVAVDDYLLVVVEQDGTTLKHIVKLDPPAGGEQPGTPAGPGGTATPGATIPSGGSWGGGGGMVQQEPAFELYALDMTTVAAVTPQSTMTLEITVDELDIKSLYLGMTAQVKVDALGGEKHTATITEIGNSGESNGGNSKYTVELTMDRTGSMLSGMNATATIVLSTANEVLTIPADALVELGNQTIVYTGYDAETETLLNPVPVKVGCSDGQTVEVLEGLTNGQTYYYAYYDTLEISFTPDFGGGGFMFG